MRIRLWCLSIAGIFLLAFSAAAADETLEAGRASSTQLTSEVADIQELKLIHADTMTLTRQKEKPQVFKGSVDIIMVDEAGLETRIKTDKMTIYYKEDLKRVERIEAEGRVRITRLGTVATTELAVYRGDKNVMELLRDPHVKDSRGELSANRISILMDSDEVVAEGNVRGVVYPEVLE